MRCKLFFTVFLAAMMTALPMAAGTITLLEPADGALYDTHSPCVREFLEHPEERGTQPPRPPKTPAELEKERLQNAAYQAWVANGKKKEQKVKPYKDNFNYYIHNPWSAALMKRDAVEEREYRPFRWEVSDKLTDAMVEFSTTADFAHPVSQAAGDLNGRSRTSLRPAYLQIGTVYFWRVKGRNAAGENVVSATREFTTAGRFPRMLLLPSANLRDLGGGVNTHGREIRQGLLFRGKAPASGKATDESVIRLYRDILGIKTELDLRGREECEKRRKEWGEKDLAALAGIRHEFLPIIPYHMHYPPNLPQFRKIFALLADRNAYPVYFHCAVGCDRTGTLAFLIDGILGRDNREMTANYELPSFDPNLPRYRYSRKARELFTTFSAGNGEYRDNVVTYLLKIGVTREQIDAIRAIMLKP